MNDAFKPFLEWLVKLIDKPLATIGMSKTEFFSLAMVLLSVALAIPAKGQFADWQAWLAANRAIIETALIGGIGLGISNRMAKVQQQIAGKSAGIDPPPNRYF